MTQKLLQLRQALETRFGSKLLSVQPALGELTVCVSAQEYSDVMKSLRDDASLKFEQLIDLCGVDYSQYKNQPWEGLRFAVVVHLLSVTHNWRLRVKVFAPDDDLPAIASVTPLWAAANWYEREAFDLLGIIFEGHEDLRRILTDYGFIGHPLRKDFPVTGHVEMRYDPQTQRVVYEPVSIEPRENIPRVVREDQYGGMH
jgi:NADH-quinone oxidoreductase subunit C